MGYFTKDIAKESVTPAIVSLSNNPNYIQFESLNGSELNKHVDISLQIANTEIELEKTRITIIESESDIKHQYKGTRDKAEVNSTTFLLSDDKAITAENIKDCLISDSFFKANFSITIPMRNNNGVIENGDTIIIASTGAGLRYAFSFEYLNADFIKLTGNPNNTIDNDSIKLAGDTEIEIEVYENNNLFLGVDATPQNDTPLGAYMVRLTKLYNNAPVWFNLNSLISSRKVVSSDFLNSTEWSNTGTITGFRFIAKRFDGINREAFYASDILYSITGYKRGLDKNDLSDYVYDTEKMNIVKPLTTQQPLTHITGQSQYFNFILSDPQRNINLGSEEYDFGINYRLYTQSNRFIAEVSQVHSRNRKQFSIVNTVKLDIDGAIGDYSDIGIVEVYLSRSGSPISEPLIFNILPECLYKVNDFAFLNSLGGWSSFNFSGTETTDFKTSANTFFKTHTPNHSISSEIESVHSKEVTEQFTVQSMPVRKSVCNWLKELSSSIAVYELSTKRYIIVDELNIKPNSKDELFRLEMKYHYSDSYNALIK